MITMIEKLKYLDVISFKKEIPTEGHSPLLVITSDFQAYYIKNTKGQMPATALINEIICHFLLKIWSIRTPDISIVTVDKSIIPNNLSHHHKPHFYNNLTFGSKQISNTVEMGQYLNITKKADYNKFRDPMDFIKLGLFDIWVENDDRKPSNTNVLFDISGDKIDIVAIDHAFTFTTQNYNQLLINDICQSYNDNLLHTDLVKEIVKYAKKQKGFSDSIKDYFYFCISKSKENYNDIVINIPS